jgi:penicillin amidase
MTFDHPMGPIGPLSLIFNRGPFPIGGNWNTVNSGAYFPDNPYQMALGPAYRFIVDLADWDNTRSVITSGQSGQPFSQHYDDNIDDWRSVDYHALPFSQTAVQENAAHTLTLLPGAP